MFALYAHLGLNWRTRVAREFRARLTALEDAGLVETGRRHGARVWELSELGHSTLDQIVAVEGMPVLPESPQHRAWRNVSRLGEQEMGRFKTDLGDAVLAAFFMLDCDPPVASDEWFVMGERMRQACRALGSALYCAREWAEPSDELADIDTHTEPSDAALPECEQTKRRSMRAGRRNLALYRTPH